VVQIRQQFFEHRFPGRKVMPTFRFAVLSLSILCQFHTLLASEFDEQQPRVSGFSRTLDERLSMKEELTVSSDRSQQNSIFANASETLVGNTSKGTVPVTLVQRVGTDFWVVQSLPQVSQNGDFATTVRFPVDRRDAVSQFLIVVISVPEQHWLHRSEPGSRVSELPKDAVASRIYRVQRTIAHIKHSAVERLETRLQ
jgi:hypothetical protein